MHIIKIDPNGPDINRKGIISKYTDAEISGGKRLCLYMFFIRCDISIKESSLIIIITIIRGKHHMTDISHTTQNPSTNKYIPTLPREQLFHQRKDVRNNQMELHGLYSNILAVFIDRIKENFEKQTISAPSPFSQVEEIERFGSAIKYFYNQAMNAYGRCVRQRQTGRNGVEEPIQGKKEEEECELVEEGVGEEQKEVETEESSHSRQAHLSFQIPNLFKNPYTPSFIIPKQEQPIKQEVQSSSDDSDSEDMRSYAAKAERRTNSLLLGNFITNKIRRKPKQEKIMVELHNIFLKLAHNGRDAYFERGTLELKKIEKSDVPIQ